uniref:Uncharacterized protein n=1 Tax=Arundo donax TaxID=35708 RepID=A0A0A8Z2G0_ARUDO
MRDSITMVSVLFLVTAVLAPSDGFLFSLEPVPPTLVAS